MTQPFPLSLRGEGWVRFSRGFAVDVAPLTLTLSPEGRGDSGANFYSSMKSARAIPSANNSAVRSPWSTRACAAAATLGLAL